METVADAQAPHTICLGQGLMYLQPSMPNSFYWSLHITTQHVWVQYLVANVQCAYNSKIYIYEKYGIL